MSRVNVIASRRHKFAALVLLLVSLTIQSLDTRPGAGGLLSDVFRTVLGVAIWFVAFERPRERAGTAAILIVIIAIGWGRHVSTTGRLDDALSLTVHALMSLYLWAAVWVLLCDLFHASAIGVENVLGAICGYLIAGDAWAGVNAVTYLAIPGTYSVNADVSALPADWQVGWRSFRITASRKC